MPSESHSDLVAPPLPVRASIYIAPDGTVHFGALFAELLPVAAALGHEVAGHGPNEPVRAVHLVHVHPGHRSPPPPSK